MPGSLGEGVWASRRRENGKKGGKPKKKQELREGNRA